MGLFNKDAKERFEETMEAGPPVAAEEIQASVGEEGKGRGLGAKQNNNFALSKAGQNLYGASQGALNLQDKLKAEREAKQQSQQRSSINDILFSVMKETEKETQKYSPSAEGTLGTATYLTQEEIRLGGGSDQRGSLGPVAEKLMTAKESGSGGYDSLYDQSQKETFKGIVPTEMTIGEVLAFQKKRGTGSYASFVKANNPSGKLSTPVGKFQYVGSTLQDEVDKNGYDLNTKFDANMQDTIFYNHANRIIKNLKTQGGKRSKMRSTWEGFKSKKAVSDKELDALISEIQSRK
jgi:hypothetical protein